jgi:hypothetical protein
MAAPVSSNPTPAPAGSRRVLHGLLLGLTLAAWAAIFLIFWPLPPRMDVAPHRVVGEMVAAEALKHREGGGRLIVITREIEHFTVPAAEAQFQAFAVAIQKAGARIDLHRVVKVDPLRVVAVPAGEYFDLLRKGKENDLIVSFLGPPQLSEDQLARLGGQRVKVVAVCSGAMPEQINLKRIFEQKLVTAALINQETRDGSKPAGDMRVQFERAWKWIRAENLSELPNPRGRG